jgi:hypothetical protein
MGYVFTIMTLLWMLLEKSVGLHDKHIDKQAIYTNLIALPAITLMFSPCSISVKTIMAAL